MKMPAIVLTAALAQAAAPQESLLGSVQGVVMRWNSTVPLPQVIVELRPETGGNPLASTATTDKGEFVFQNIPAGRYRLLATRAGFAPAEYGQRRPGGAGQAFALNAGEPKTGLRIEISPGAAVFGRVLDRSGLPLPLADVRLEKLDYGSGRAGLLPVQSSITNDLGEYRIYWITPGQYYLRASATNSQNFGAAAGSAFASWSGSWSFGARAAANPGDLAGRVYQIHPQRRPRHPGCGACSRGTTCRSG